MKSQRSARILPSPLRLPRSSVWGSQSNLLDLKPAVPQQNGRLSTEPDLQRSPDADLPRHVAAPLKQAPQPGLEQEQQRQLIKQSEASEAPVDQGKDAAQPEGGTVKATALPSAKSEILQENQPTLEGQHIAFQGSPDQARSSQGTAEPDAKAAEVAGSLGGGKDSFARPMKALISTVAKVGISPTAGMMLGSVATRTRRPRKEASTELPANIPAEVATPDQGPGSQSLPNGRVVASEGLMGKHGLNQASLRPRSVASAASLPNGKDASNLLAPQLAVHLQTPTTAEGQQALSGSKRSRRSLAAPHSACERSGLRTLIGIVCVIVASGRISDT